MEEKIEKHMELLVDRINSEFGLLDKLLAKRILSREDVHRIQLKDNTTEDKNRLLLNLILKNRKANELVSALQDIGQVQLVNYLNTDGDYRFSFGDDWPLNESEINRLEINRERLVELLDTSDLCNKLFSVEVINNRQKELILSKPTYAEKNEALLDMLTKVSIRQYKQTIACLNDSNQRHLADLLSEGGVVVRVHANLEGAVGNVDEMEDKIISQLAKVLENQSLDEATRLLKLTHHRIIAARKGQSIVLYIHCMMHDELLQLNDLLEKNKLKETVERVFIEMLSIGDTLKVPLTWSWKEFKRASTYFDEKYISNRKKLMTSTTENEQLIEIEQERQRDKVKIEELEGELYRERRRSADLIEDRRRIQEELEKQKRRYDKLNDELERLRMERTASSLGEVRLKEQFHDSRSEKKVCYKDDPILVKTIRTKAAEGNGKGISGLAITDNELFMTSFQTNVVEVYDLKNLTLTRSWKLDPLINPYDLGYCNINKCLYVMDMTYIEFPKKLFRVDRNGKLLNFWTTRMGYGCISVTFDCNVVMAEYEGHTITEYKADGQIAREITLPTKAGFAHPRYAIKLTKDRFLISFGEGDDPLHRVCELDVIGNILISFGGPRGSTSDRLNTPIYLTIDSNGSIIVTDRDNSRVLALTSDLEFMREIISTKREGMHRPERIVIDQANGRLLVAHNDVYWSECRIFVFQIL